MQIVREGQRKAEQRQHDKPHCRRLDDNAKSLINSLLWRRNGVLSKPYHSLERGANENTNGLIRQYIPKKTDFGDVEQDFVSIIQNKQNNRPRKRLGWLTPIEMFYKLTNLDFVALAT